MCPCNFSFDHGATYDYCRALRKHPPPFAVAVSFAVSCTPSTLDAQNPLWTNTWRFWSRGLLGDPSGACYREAERMVGSGTQAVPPDPKSAANYAELCFCILMRLCADPLRGSSR